MCFGSKDNTDDPAPKPAQVPQQPRTSSPTSRPPPSKANMPEDYAAPPGPPPSHYAGAPSSADYAVPPPIPPPSHFRADAGDLADVAPPPGPPPSKAKNNPFFDSAPAADDFQPPPGPPPGHASASASASNELKPPQDWETAVPDTSLLPPPPNYFSGFDRSPANNATEEQAEAGERWCADYPLYAPILPDGAALEAAARGDVGVFAPPCYLGQVAQVAPGVWRGRTHRGAADACLATYPPLYSARAHLPAAGNVKEKTIYYEVRILDDSRADEVSLALGFAAPPYPPFRLPGWHRASLAVHGDDGHRYVNDRWGGKTFTRPFRRGETLGVGMAFGPGAGGLGTRVEVFLTRGGREEGRWNLHEETDLHEDLPVDGLEGSRDLCAAVGVFDAVSFEIVFRPELWAWKGYRG
ncbi:hypothetical protein DL766_010083 [Monosporascus sp. MC13-8B]|uniref:SPRY domain-containing protein n=1 Tax=Monosporascus cannonballus TaxID=155416 RepID=A0ABY0H1S6_9PEZI|nr:hypothetical protein DL762_006845 [Monosporascus cannonballus]RYO85726.1 hypothetical protein DL763_006982 [Monosporascus cannonballus]RYP10960.1 hypothetical protein DL766_010083 [Monosporascus sp. MC13-8B]